MSTDLVTVDLQKVFGKIAEVLPAFPAVAGAYLFGSSRGPCRPDSDLDLGLILFAPREDELHLEAHLEAALGAVDGHPFSVLTLRPGYFAWKAIRGGELCYEKDDRVVTDFIEKTALLHEDDAHALAIFHAARREGLRA